jgi:hypothetical protein
MRVFSLPNASVASSGGEYFQVSFANEKDSGDAHFLIQRQFESPDGGRVYIESHEQLLCGHFKIRKAELRRDVFRLEIACRPPKRSRYDFRPMQVDMTNSGPC